MCVYMCLRMCSLKFIPPEKYSFADRQQKKSARQAAKGNAGHEPTSRTQRRNHVSMGLDGVREAARASKAAGQKVRFTALMHHITPQLRSTASGN